MKRYIVVIKNNGVEVNLRIKVQNESEVMDKLSKYKYDEIVRIYENQPKRTSQEIQRNYQFSMVGLVLDKNLVKGSSRKIKCYY